MSATLAMLLADVQSAVSTVGRLDVEALPSLVAARLLLACEDTRSALRRAVDAAVAVEPAEKTVGPLPERRRQNLQTATPKEPHP